MKSSHLPHTLFIDDPSVLSNQKRAIQISARVVIVHYLIDAFRFRFSGYLRHAMVLCAGNKQNHQAGRSYTVLHFPSENLPHAAPPCARHHATLQCKKLFQLFSFAIHSESD
jgi:hypothetical protein